MTWCRSVFVGCTSGAENCVKNFRFDLIFIKSVYNACMDAIKHQKVEGNYINQELLDFYFRKS